MSGSTCQSSGSSSGTNGKHFVVGAVCNDVMLNYPKYWGTFTLQWGSEFWTSPDFEGSKGGWFANGLDFEWDLKSGQMVAILSKPIEIWIDMFGF